MKPQINPQAILDLLRHIDRTTAFRKALLESALEHLDILEDGDEEAFVEVVPEDPRLLYPGLDTPDEMATVRACIKELALELHNHVDKKALLQAALNALAPHIDRKRKLTALEEKIQRAFRQLDPRTKALIEIRDELLRVDGVCNTAFCRCIDIGQVDVETVLGGDPSLGDLLEAFRLAHSLLEAHKAGY